MTEYTLSQLLESGENKHTLPIDIQFADEVQAKSVGMAFREIDKTLHIRIFEQFDEIFLLGNPLWRGCVYSKVIEIPVYLPKMTMAVATGIKGYDAETWRRYKSEMRDSIEKNTQVDVRYGRKDIAVYSTDVLHTYNSYTFLPPLSYIKIGPDESRCCLSLSLDCIFEPLFLTDEQKELKKENNGITNVKTDKSGQEYNIPCVEKLKLSKDKSESGKQTGQQNDERYSESENSLKEKGIEFDYPQEGMTVKEFYDRFKDQLPKIVLITEGYHGETGIESFGRGQIIRIHTIFKQQRVKAELVHGRGTNPEDYHISIPLDYKANFYEVKHIEFPKPKEKSLSEILKKHKIRHHPEVKFAKLEEGLILHLDSKIRKSSTNIHLRLLDGYDDIYLLGNPISEGCLYARVMSVPIFLQNLKLSVISGIKGCSEESWKKYQEEMTETVNQNVTFDGNYGNENIAVYSKEKSTTASYVTYLSPPGFHCDSGKTNGNGKSEILQKEFEPKCDDICLYKPHALLNRLNLSTDKTESLEGHQSEENFTKDSSEAVQMISRNTSDSSMPNKVGKKQESNREEKFGIKFTHEEKEYSVQEFYEAHNIQLPLFVVVAQGHYGDIGMETLDMGQVIRVHGFKTQKRRITKFKNGHKLLTGKLASIPLDYPLEFKTVENDKVQSHRMCLQKILDFNQLPVDIKLDPIETDRCVIGQRIFRCSDVPVMSVMNQIEVMYLIGNPISDGCLYSRIVEIPVKLPDVKLSIVTGAVNAPESAWLSYIQGMSKTVQEKIKFDEEYGHRDITFYSPDEDKTENNKTLESNINLGDEDISVETETSVEAQGESHDLLVEVLAAACGRRPESVCLYEPYLLTLDSRKSLSQETSTDD